MAEKKKSKKPNIVKLIASLENNLTAKIDSLASNVDKRFITLERKVDSHTADIIKNQEKVMVALDGVSLMIEQQNVVKNHEQRIETLEQDMTAVKVAIKSIS